MAEIVAWFVVGVEKERKRPEPTPVELVQRARKRRDRALETLQWVTDPDLVDAFIYEVAAAEREWDFAHRLATGRERSGHRRVWPWLQRRAKVVRVVRVA